MLSFAVVNHCVTIVIIGVHQLQIALLVPVISLLHSSLVFFSGADQPIFHLGQVLPNGVFTSG